MALKKKVKDIKDIPEALRDHYVKKGGFYVLDTERDEDDTEDDDSESRSKLSEMRSNNIKLLKEKKELEEKLAGIDMEMLEAGKKASENARNEEEKKLLREGKFDMVFNQRLEKLKGEYETKVGKLNEQLGLTVEHVSNLRDNLRGTKVANHAIRAAQRKKLNLQPTAMEDYVRRALDIYDIDEDGNVVAVDEEGNPRLNSESRPFSDDDFLTQVLEEAPHLLQGSSGADMKGTGGSRRAPGVIEINASDPKAFGNNLEAIAGGKINARMTQ